MVEREMIKKWGLPDVSDLQLYTILNTLTRKQMMIICDFLQIVNRSNLKKGDIKAILHSDLYHYLAKYLQAMNDGQLQLLYELLEKDYLSIDEYAWSHLYFFFQLGIAYPVGFQEKYGFFIPREIKRWIIERLTPSLMRLFDRNNRVITFAYDCLKAYGLIHYQTFVYFYQMKHPDDDVFHDVDLILRLESTFNGRFYANFQYFYDVTIKDQLSTFLNVHHRYHHIDYFQFQLNEDEFQRMFQEQEIWDILEKPIRRLETKQKEDLLKWTIHQLHIGTGLSSLEERLLDEFPHLSRWTMWRFFRNVEKIYPYLRLWIFKGNRLIDLKLEDKHHLISKI